MKSYVYERQTEYWTSRGIEDYFLDAGFELVTFPLSQVTEHEVPFDFIFFEKATCKIFGFQYKALYQDARDYWLLNEYQHQRLQTFSDWGYYCFSEMRSVRDHRIAIHRALFVPVTLTFRPKVYPGQLDAMYYRWGGFYNGLEQCPVGRRVTSPEEVKQALRPVVRDYIEEVDRNIVDTFVANIDARRVLHLKNHG